MLKLLALLIAFSLSVPAFSAGLGFNPFDKKSPTSVAPQKPAPTAPVSSPAAVPKPVSTPVAPAKQAQSPSSAVPTNKK
jgi:hypothetical protein